MKLAIDAGHGMGNRTPGVYDPGAVYGDITEAEIALAWALTIKYFATQAGIECFLIRSGDTDSNPVGGRDNQAVAAGCTHFLSIHVNAGGGTGPETYYRGEANKPWARLIQASVVGASKAKDRGLKLESSSQHSHLAVLNFPGPACLHELGFIDSAKDRAYMMDSQCRKKAAMAYVAGLLKVNS